MQVEEVEVDVDSPADEVDAPDRVAHERNQHGVVANLEHVAGGPGDDAADGADAGDAATDEIGGEVLVRRQRPRSDDQRLGGQRQSRLAGVHAADAYDRALSGAAELLDRRLELADPNRDADRERCGGIDEVKAAVETVCPPDGAGSNRPFSR